MKNTNYSIGSLFPRSIISKNIKSDVNMFFAATHLHSERETAQGGGCLLQGTLRPCKECENSVCIDWSLVSSWALQGLPAAYFIKEHDSILFSFCIFSGSSYWVHARLAHFGSWRWIWCTRGVSGRLARGRWSRAIGMAVLASSGCGALLWREALQASAFQTVVILVKAPFHIWMCNRILTAVNMSKRF